MNCDRQGRNWIVREKKLIKTNFILNETKLPEKDFLLITSDPRSLETHHLFSRLTSNPMAV